MIYKMLLLNGRQLLWVVLIGLIFALIIQSLAANLGVSTGKYSSTILSILSISFHSFALSFPKNPYINGGYSLFVNP